MAILSSALADDLIRFVNRLKRSLSFTSQHQRLPPLTRELLRLRGRSEEMLKEFGSYFCLRLVLDDDSPLALQFMDFFCDLHWLMEGFEQEVRRSFLATKSAAEEAVELGKALLESLQTVVDICRFLHLVYSFGFERPQGKLVEFKRKAKPYRMFWKNVIDCQIRDRGLVNLDRSGDVRVVLDEELGKGGFGTVYKGHFIKSQCVDLNSDRERVGDPVAVKMMHYTKLQLSNSECALQNLKPDGEQNKVLVEPRNTSYVEQLICAGGFDAQLVGSFEGTTGSVCLSELLKLASFRHPNIVDVRGYIGRRMEIFDFGIVMELMDTSLHDKLIAWKAEGKRLKELDMIDLMLEIAKGMRFLHERDALHLDLKPRNVLLKSVEQGVAEFLEVKLADLGLTKFMVSGTDMESCVGTSYYMAPELRMRMSTYTDKADVFSYGSTCFNIVTGNPEMREITCTNVDGFYAAIESGRWTEWVKGIPTSLVKIIELCWLIEASKRPTFAEICLVLQYQKRQFLAAECKAQQAQQCSPYVRTKAMLLGKLPACSPMCLEETSVDSLQRQFEQNVHKRTSRLAYKGLGIQNLESQLEKIGIKVPTSLSAYRRSPSQELTRKSISLSRLLTRINL